MVLLHMIVLFDGKYENLKSYLYVLPDHRGTCIVDLIAGELTRGWTTHNMSMQC